MRQWIASLLVLCAVTVQANETQTTNENDTHLIVLESAYGVATTMDRLEAALTDKGMTVFARVNHAAGAEKIGKTLRPTELLIFGNPKAGTPLMQCDQAVAIELPQKALIWQDEAGKTWLSYKNPQALADRYDMADCKKVLNKVETAMKRFAMAATVE